MSNINKPVEISHKSWERLLKKLRTEYKPSVTLTRTGMRKKLGFVWREYSEWDHEKNTWKKNCVMLDFYNEKKRTFFMVKYSEFLNKS